MVTGDLTQTDLPSGQAVGPAHALDILPGVAGVAFSHFDASDVVRHPLVQRIVRAYEEKDRHERAHARTRSWIAACRARARRVPARRG